MDDSVIEILDDSDVVEVDDKENAGKDSVNASVAVVLPDKRKATRGGLKLDDTVELLDDSEDEVRAQENGAAGGDRHGLPLLLPPSALHKTEANDETAAFATANNSVATPSRPLLLDDPAVKSFVTSTPAAIPTQVTTAVGDFVTSTPAVPTTTTVHDDVNNHTYERSETVRMDEIRDEMCDSYEEKPAAPVMTNTEMPAVPVMTNTEVPEEAEGEPAVTNTGLQEEVDAANGQSSSDDYDEEPDVVSTASQSPILGKSVEDQANGVEEEEEDNREDVSEEDEVVGEREEAPLEQEESAETAGGGADTMAMPSKASRVLDPEQLPETCTMLTVPNGGRVYLVGTAHFSKESNEDVAAVIQAVKPDIVVLELCKARTSVLHLDEEKSLELAQQLTLEKVMEMVRSQGALQGVMTCTMLSMSAHLTKELGMAPGGEFRRAYREAKAVPGCLVHLGDRPIQVTLKRAFGSLSVWQMVKLAFTMLTSNVKVTKEDVEKYKQKDILEAMLEEMAGEYPSFTRVLVEERDTFLAHSMRLAVEMPCRVAPGHAQQTTADGSDVCPPVVVGVVGIGHVQGIVRKWDTVTEDDVAQVVKIPRPTRSQRLAKFVVKSTFVLLTLYGTYRLVRNPLHRLSKVIVK